MPSKTKILSAAAGVLLLSVCLSHGGTLLGIPSAWAEGSVVTDTQGGIMGGLLFAVGMLNFLAFFLIKLLAYLIDPGTIMGISGSGTSTIMLRLWQVSRDIMNLLFAMMLLGAAIMTIVFGKQEIVKQHLVKFILAVILVNFSWFFPRVILDVANVATATIYGLPNLVNSKCLWTDKNGMGQPCIVVEDVKFFSDTSACPTTTTAPLDIGKIMKVCRAPLAAGSNNGFGIFNGLVTNHGRLTYLGVISGSPPSGGTGGQVQETMRLTLIMAMVTFLHVMLVFPLIALTAVMIIRIPILWLTISFMPFMFIGFVIGDKFVKVNSMEIFTKHFITAAFLPAIVAVPFSIGYIMLNEVATLSQHLPGVAPTMAPPAGLEGKVDFFPQAENWWQAIWILLSFMIIWMGSRAAMKRDEIYSKFTEPIFNVGNSFLKLPVTVPLIPHDTSGSGQKSSISDSFRNLQSSRGLATMAFPKMMGAGASPGAGGIAPNTGKDINGTLGELKRENIPKEQLNQHITAFKTLMQQQSHATETVAQAIQALRDTNQRRPPAEQLKEPEILQIQKNFQDSGQFKP